MSIIIKIPKSKGDVAGLKDLRMSKRPATSIKTAGKIILKATPVYYTYWQFASERQKIFFARLNGLEGPWTDDEILQKYKFTNVYRASDRVSQFLIRNVIYKETYQILLKILLFEFCSLKYLIKLKRGDYLKKTLEERFHVRIFQLKDLVKFLTKPRVLVTPSIPQHI